MKIAHVTSTFPPHWSGTGLAAYNQARALKSRGNEVRVFIPGTPENRAFDYAGLHVNRLFTLLRYGEAPLVPGLLGLRGVDIIHLHFPYYFGAEIVTLLSWLRKIPVVVTYHNDVILKGIPGRIVDFHTQHIAPTILRRAARVCVMSQRFAGRSPLIQKIEHHKNLALLPHGVDVDLFHPEVEKRPLHRELGIDSGVPIVLFVRALDDAHHLCGLSVLLGAMQKMRARCHLVVVGDGNRRPSFEKQAIDAGVSDRVTFVGAVKNSDLPGYYSASSIFVLPSLETESFGLVILEALACGTPAIASDLGGIGDCLRAGDEGLLVPPGSPEALAGAMEELLSDREKLDRFGLAGSTRASREASWDAIAGKLEALYEDVISEAKAGRGRNHRHERKETVALGK